MDAMELLSTRASHAKLGEPAPDEATLTRIFNAALRAPDHALLRPWRILVIRGAARERLGDVFARTAARDPDASPDKIERARRKALRAPLLIAVAATPVVHPKVPEIEQVLSAGAVAHGILLGLHAEGFAAMWRTGAPAYDPEVKQALGLRAEDHIVGFLYAGTAMQDAPSITRPSPERHVEHWTG